MTKAGLNIIFNHRFERNLPKLEEYYSPRFTDRHYLMPFATSDQPNVIRVIENGWSFSGHIAQAVHDFKRSDVTHYVFLGDDLILNPRLDEANLVDALHLEQGMAYIKSLASVDDVRFRWHWSIYAYRSLLKPRLDYLNELPPVEEALRRMQALGIDFKKPRPRSGKDLKWLKVPWVHRKPREWHWNLKLMSPHLRSVMEIVESIGKACPYPLLAGYSDFVIVPAEHLDLFAHYCGVFAAMNLFAEIAVPTALALACPSIKTELVMGTHFADRDPPRRADSSMRGVEFWEGEIEEFCKSYDFSWSALMSKYPEDVLYYHPVKLSKWK